MLMPNIWLAVTFLVSLVLALQVELPAMQDPTPTCIRDFVGRDQMVVVNLKTTGYRGDGQQLLLTVHDTLGNRFYKKDDISGEVRAVFTTQDAAAIDICLTNRAEPGRNRVYLTREVEIDVESGAAARDWNAVQAAEKLQPAEVELRRIAEMTSEIAHQLLYLKNREARMRDTNESTNSRVKWFSVLIVLALIGLGGWQIQYLRHYFKVKHII